MKNQTEILMLVGGPGAGTRVAIPEDLDYYTMVVPTNLSPFFLTEECAAQNIQTVEYTRQNFITNNGEIFKILVVNGMTYVDVVAELIKGYYKKGE